MRSIAVSSDVTCARAVATRRMSGVPSPISSQALSRPIRRLVPPARMAAVTVSSRIKRGQYGRRVDELVVLTREPLNAETPLSRQVGPITPVGRHFVRSHFPAPPPPQQITFSGLFAQPFEITRAKLQALPARTLAVTLECAANGRAFLDPPAPGEQWGLGAVGTAEWTGVPLAELVARAAPLPEGQPFG